MTIKLHWFVMIKLVHLLNEKSVAYDILTKVKVVVHIGKHWEDCTMLVDDLVANSLIICARSKVIIVWSQLSLLLIISDDEKSYIHYNNQMNHFPVKVLPQLFSKIGLKNRLECLFVCHFLEQSTLLYNPSISDGQVPKFKDMVEHFSYRGEQNWICVSFRLIHCDLILLRNYLGYQKVLYNDVIFPSYQWISLKIYKISLKEFQVFFKIFDQFHYPVTLLGNALYDKYNAVY
ncbi:hypothetical protein K501DRAFT_270039 [Backusella circina FSU 941]|nr:hypothetical protein K501DRAFT_270039 [Backusella circina FSU 941]